MAIDLEREKLITPTEAAKLIPSRREGKKVHFLTIVRWIRYGHRGTFLEGVRQPGGWATSVQAVQRFLSSLAQKEHAQPEHIVKRQQEIENARAHEECVKRSKLKGLM